MTTDGILLINMAQAVNAACVLLLAIKGEFLTAKLDDAAVNIADESRRIGFVDGYNGACQILTGTSGRLAPDLLPAKTKQDTARLREKCICRRLPVRRKVYH
ncbi:hypothetical protein A6M21_08655 [Desulfotomaculum copahuensis]|uniref:Uncharacterized protein n=1 Tax=Desulfotomaculum copahuensis TaxID=1838280 RepID=A0A1B7LF10_9FIRM|nr:hypothetical protein A6M21_08655 [Desulfotomaculum copahuensis]